MMKEQKRLNHLLRNKSIIIGIGLAIVIGLVIFVINKTYKSPIERKLIGTWNMEFENFSCYRDSVYEFMVGIIEIKNDTVLFPEVYEPSEVDFQGKKYGDKDFDIFDNKENVEKEIKRDERMDKKRKGTWKIISTDPDSVFFDVPNSPLRGKYAIRFFIDEKGYGELKNNIYKIELKNDSTYLICNKGGFVYIKSRKEWVK